MNKYIYIVHVHYKGTTGIMAVCTNKKQAQKMVREAQTLYDREDTWICKYSTNEIVAYRYIWENLK